MDVVLLHCQASVYDLPTKLAIQVLLGVHSSASVHVAQLTGMQSKHMCGCW